MSSLSWSLSALAPVPGETPATATTGRQCPISTLGQRPPNPLLLRLASHDIQTLIVGPDAALTNKFCYIVNKFCGFSFDCVCPLYKLIVTDYSRNNQLFNGHMVVGRFISKGLVNFVIDRDRDVIYT